MALNDDDGSDLDWSRDRGAGQADMPDEDTGGGGEPHDTWDDVPNMGDRDPGYSSEPGSKPPERNDKPPPGMKPPGKQLGAHRFIGALGGFDNSSTVGRLAGENLGLVMDETLTDETRRAWDAARAHATKISEALHSIASGNIDGLAGKALELFNGGQAAAAAERFDTAVTDAEGRWAEAKLNQSENDGARAVYYLQTANSAAETDFLGQTPVKGQRDMIDDEKKGIADALPDLSIPWGKIALIGGGLLAAAIVLILLIRSGGAAPAAA